LKQACALQQTRGTRAPQNRHRDIVVAWIIPSPFEAPMDRPVRIVHHLAAVTLVSAIAIEFVL
jgi:hypothetical protein